jgi:hypothetical protein
VEIDGRRHYPALLHDLAKQGFRLRNLFIAQTDYITFISLMPVYATKNLLLARQSSFPGR